MLDPHLHAVRKQEIDHLKNRNTLCSSHNSVSIVFFLLSLFGEIWHRLGSGFICMSRLE